MDKATSLDSLFTKKMFRVPDYQRGYAWEREHLRAFWEDLVNLSDNRKHYTGVLTLKQIPITQIDRSEKEYWLMDEHAYELYHVVDGQQRLTTFVIFLQAFIEFIKSLPENQGRDDNSIYVTDTLRITDVQSNYLFRVKPSGDHFRTYKFAYAADDPSGKYLRYNTFGESGAESVTKTFYTLNLGNAKDYFSKQLGATHAQADMVGLQVIYRKLTKQLFFNTDIINDDYDVFVAFETMNNRGKKLSDLELLKNRLIYLTTLYSNNELDLAQRKSLRDRVNDAWKEVYRQLGRNSVRPLNDDDFLRTLDDVLQVLAKDRARLHTFPP